MKSILVFVEMDYLNHQLQFYVVEELVKYYYTRVNPCFTI